MLLSISLPSSEPVYILQKQCVLFGYREIDRVCLCVYGGVQKSVFGFAKRLSSYLDRLFAQKEIALFAPSVPVYSIVCTGPSSFRGKGAVKSQSPPTFEKNQKNSDPKKVLPKNISQNIYPQNFWPSNLKILTRVLNIYSTASFCI